jgi:hypothetical protein
MLQMGWGWGLWGWKWRQYRCWLLRSDSSVRHTLRPHNNHRPPARLPKPQAEEQSVQARSVERRRPEMAANRRAAAAAAKRSPRLTKRAAATGRSAKRKADHQTFQPRKQN